MEPVVNERERRHAQYLETHGVPLPESWYNHNAFLTLFFSAGSIAIPEAERMVVRTVEEVAAKQKLPHLEKEIENIIHEESAHARVHDAFNKYLKTTGLPVEQHLQASRRITALASSKIFSLKTRLAICATIEHFTATGARHILDTGMFEGKEVDERMDRVWTWHALEELDHRSTVFDIYVAMGGGYVRRICSALVGTMFFLYGHHVCFISFLRHEELLWNRKAWASGLPLLLGKGGIYREMFKDWLKLFRPGFHPTDIQVANRLQKQLHHYHIESELIKYFTSAV
ncbi:MAG TPA: metal-dependent hydrolase [Candidatus Paceibacterota bacterium]|jgi:predicted metal-dependent hydrolase|nr:metal-dependent hydrolase [Candidatus Paceibacterota bacterium]